MATRKGTAKGAADTAPMDLGVVAGGEPPPRPPVDLDVTAPAQVAPAPATETPPAKPAPAPTKAPKKVGPYWVGRPYFIRTVTSYFLGMLADVTDQELVLTDASWVADTDRFAEFLKSGIPTEAAPGLRIEVEPYPAGEVVIGRGALVDACQWPHPLPRETVPALEKR